MISSRFRARGTTRDFLNVDEVYEFQTRGVVLPVDKLTIISGQPSELREEGRQATFNLC